MDHDQLAALYQDEERDVSEALDRCLHGMNTADDEALLRSRLGLSPRKQRPTPNINAAEQPF